MNNEYRHILQTIGATERTDYWHIHRVIGGDYNTTACQINDMLRWGWVTEYFGQVELTDKGLQAYAAHPAAT